MPFNRFFAGAIPVSLALAGAVVLAVSVMPEAALADSSGCTGTEISRTTTTTVIVPGVLVYVTVVRKILKADGTTCYLQSTYRGTSGTTGTTGTGTDNGATDPTTTHLVHNPLYGVNTTPPWQTDNTGDESDEEPVEDRINSLRKNIENSQEQIDKLKKDVEHNKQLIVRWKEISEETSKEIEERKNDLDKKLGTDSNNLNEMHSKLNAMKDSISEEQYDNLKISFDYYVNLLSKQGFFSADSKYLQEKNDKLQRQIVAEQHAIDNAKREIAKLNQQAGRQTKAGSPPDLGPRDWTSNFKWWSSGSVGHFADNGSANTIAGLTGQTMIGGDILLRPRLSVGFGVGVHSSNNDTTTGNSFVNGADLLARGFWGPNDRLWFDATLGYGYSRVAENDGGITDAFDFHQFGIGAGVNVSQPLTARWRFDGRLGWSGSLSKRAASTDSIGFTQAATSGNFGQARADARLTYLCDGGEVFADGALRWVTNDSTDSADRFDGELGGGFSLAVGRGMTLTGRGYTVVGHDAYEEYGASLQLTGQF